jgi:large subunit ribosomal protein L13
MVHHKLLGKENLKEKEIIEIDAAHQSLGRLAVKIAYFLQGKHKPHYKPYIDFPVFIHLKNWEKILFTGKKIDNRYIYKHTGYLGHLRKYSLKELWQKKPLWVIKKAVANMLPKNKLRKKRLARIILS